MTGAARTALSATLAALLALALCCGALPVRADDSKPVAKPEAAQAGGAKAQKKPAAKPKKTAARKALEAIGGEFESRDAAALVARAQAGAKIELTLAGKTGQYRAKQAKKNLQDWFDKLRSVSSATLDRVSGAHGSYTLVAKVKGRDTALRFALTVELREVKPAKVGQPSRFYLRKIEVRRIAGKPRAKTP